MSNIEPTEEQKQAARGWLAHYALPSMFVDGLARLLAEREAKLREEVSDARSYGAHLSGDNSTLRARVAELEEERAASIEARRGVDRYRREREAQHLADIKALHQFLGDHEEEEGIWIPRSEFKNTPCRKYLDDAKAEGGEG